MASDPVGIRRRIDAGLDRHRQLVLATLFGLYPFLKKLFADGGYQGPKFRAALAKLLPEVAVELR
jgi:hypothetical protein